MDSADAVARGPSGQDSEGESKSCHTKARGESVIGATRGETGVVRPRLKRLMYFL